MDGQSTSGGTCCNSQHSNISSSSSTSSSGGGATVSDDSTTLFHDNNNPLLYLSSSSSSSHHPHYHSSRRCFLTNHAAAAAAAVTMSPFILYPKESFAKGDIASTSQQGQESRLVESIRQSAAKLPGYGTPDVYYPPSFLGQWRATRTIVSTSLLEGWWSSNSNPLFLFSPSSSREQLLLSSFMKMPFVLTYNVRFIAVGGGKSEAVLSSSSSWNDFQVIADRAYNAASVHNALTSKLEELKEETGTGELKDDKDRLVLLLPSIQKIDWSPSNPNTCTMYYGDGSWKELRVTKRATELDVERGTVFSSEYQRISTISSSSSSSSSVNGGTVGGIPSVEAVRVMTKWKMQEKEKEEEEGRRNPQVVEGIEIVYLDGGTAFTTPSASSANAKVVMKSRLRLERIV